MKTRKPSKNLAFSICLAPSHSILLHPKNNRLMGHRLNIPLTCLSAPGGCTKNRYFICVPKIPLPQVLIHLFIHWYCDKKIFFQICGDTGTRRSIECRKKPFLLTCTPFPRWALVSSLTNCYLGHSYWCKVVKSIPFGKQIPLINSVIGRLFVE